MHARSTARSIGICDVRHLPVETIFQRETREALKMTPTCIAKEWRRLTAAYARATHRQAAAHYRRAPRSMSVDGSAAS